MSNPFSYENKRVVVTGGATGVGAGLLEVLAEQGAAHVTVLDLKEPTGPHSRFMQCDLSDQVAVVAAVAAIDGPVDVLFNNAGVADTLPPATVISVNYLALRALSEGLLPKMPDGAAIVNTASIAGGQWPTRLDMINEVLDLGGQWESTLAWLDSHDIGTQPYAFSKELVQVYTMRSSRPTQQRGVRTNSVCPAPIDTPLLKDFRETMTDKLIDWTVEQSKGRPVSPREVGLVLAFLGSDAAAYVNGVNLLVDAGFTAAMTTGQVDFAAISLGVSTVAVERADEAIRVIRLDRPDRLNAISFELVADLHDALDEVAADETCKVAVLTGAGRGFCAGLDLRDFGTPPSAGEHPHSPAGTTGQSFMSNLTQHIRATPQIVVAAVNGPAFGGGLSLALACDLRVAARSATFCSAFIKTGLTGTDIGVTYLLPRLIGASRAFDLIVTGRTVDADTAEHLGIVSQVFDDDGFFDTALGVAEGIAAYTGIGLRMTKEVMWANLDTPNMAACIALENRNQEIAGKSPEVQEYMRAYSGHVTG